MKLSVKFADIENKSVTELIKQKNELSTKLFDMKMKNSLGQLSSPHQVRNVRRNIARINTALVRKAAR
ncbi:MAG: 50S ribosomal protein L29 [Bdellovibrionota bacterium]|jgi:large subunit ribosomal protein L29